MSDFNDNNKPKRGRPKKTEALLIFKLINDYNQEYSLMWPVWLEECDRKIKEYLKDKDYNEIKRTVQQYDKKHKTEYFDYLEEIVNGLTSERLQQIERLNTKPQTDLRATITETEKTLDESVHEIIYNEIPTDENEKQLTDTLLDIILNEPNLKESIINKIENKKTTTYTEAHRRAQQKYREKDRAKYNEAQKKVYERIKNDEERIQKRKELSRENQRKYARD